MKRLLQFVAGIIVCLVSGTHPAVGASTITATITFTNAANLYAASYGAGASVTANSDARAWTNTVTSAATQVPITASSGTNIAQQVQLFLAHVASHPFTGLTPASDGATYVSLRGTNDQAVSVSLSPSTAWRVSYSTNTVGTGYALRLPITVEAAATRTNLANYMLSALAYGTENPLIQLGTSNATVKPIRLSTGLLSLEAGTGMGVSMTSTSIVFAASGSTPTANSVWVSKSGDDSTGARGSLTTAFLTLGAAKTNAVSGDTIFVLPGTYNESDLLKTGVNWHFFNGSVVTNTSGTVAIFDDVAGAVVSDITGDGVFSDDGNYAAVEAQTAGSIISVKAKKILGADNLVVAYNGTLVVEAGEICGTGDDVVLANGGACDLTINRTRIKSTSTNTTARAISFSGSENLVKLRDCALIVTTNATYSISAGSASDVRIYGTLTATMTNNANITFITGATRFEVDPDVQ